MATKVKLSKRQIKEDKFTAFVLTAKDQVMLNWQYYLVGAVALVLVIVGVVYLINSQSTANRAAADLFSQGMGEHRQGNNQVAILTFARVLEEYGGEVEAENATFMLGRLNLETNNFSEAIRYFEMYLSKYKQKLNRASALAGIAAAREGQLQYADAAKQFEAAIAEYPDGPLVADYHVGAIRNFVLANDLEAARKHFDEIELKFPGSRWEEQAIFLLSEKTGV